MYINDDTGEQMPVSYKIVITITVVVKKIPWLTSIGVTKISVCCTVFSRIIAVDASSQISDFQYLEMLKFGYFNVKYGG